MSKRFPIVAAVVLLACAKSEEATTDTAAAAPAAAPAAIDAASLAGKWTQVVRAEGSDSVLVSSELNIGTDVNSWTITLPGRPPLPVRVTVSGDSIMTEAGPYESVLRKGVQVTTYGVLRQVEPNKLAGTTIARYSGASADSVVRLRSEATRTP